MQNAPLKAPVFAPTRSRPSTAQPSFGRPVVRGEMQQELVVRSRSAQQIKIAHRPAQETQLDFFQSLRLTNPNISTRLSGNTALSRAKQMREQQKKDVADFHLNSPVTASMVRTASTARIPPASSWKHKKPLIASNSRSMSGVELLQRVDTAIQVTEQRDQSFDLLIKESNELRQMLCFDLVEEEKQQVLQSLSAVDEKVRAIRNELANSRAKFQTVLVGKTK